VFGHNYSIFLAQRDESGVLRLRGGAGGASTVGGAFGLNPASILIILPLGLFIWFGIGYASLATMSVALASIIVFGIFAALGITPWQYIVYGVLTEIILIWALRPNIQRLLNGTERVIGWRARRQKKREAENSPQHTNQSTNSSS
jgi:glycerol-3-phosphate acyltransferase PlsY